MIIILKEHVDERLKEIIKLGDKWNREDIPGPSDSVIRDAKLVFKYIWECCDLYPSRIDPTASKGLYIEYPCLGFKLKLKIYNEGGASVLLTDGYLCLDVFNINDTFLRVDEICDLMKKILIK